MSSAQGATRPCTAVLCEVPLIVLKLMRRKVDYAKCKAHFISVRRGEFPLLLPTFLGTLDVLADETPLALTITHTRMQTQAYRQRQTNTLDGASFLPQ